MIADGTSKTSLVGFSSFQQKHISNFKERKQAEDCEIKQAPRGTKMEVMLKGGTRIEDSPK